MNEESFKLSELGDGWGPCIINSEEELNFIWSRELQVQERVSYVGIGGSTNSQGQGFFLPDYRSDGNGRFIFLSAFPGFRTCIRIQMRK